jgi:hypothetical protein
METEQIVGIYKILEREKIIESVALWSCFFNYNGKDYLLQMSIDVVRMSASDNPEDLIALKEASNSYVAEYRKTDKLCNSPIRSKYLSQNCLDNYLFVEGICKNMRITQILTKIAFCGLRLSVDSMNVLNETLIKNKVLKELTFNYCLLDLSLIEALMPCLC